MIWSFRTNGNYVDFVHTEETSLQNEEVVFHLHNTSRCVSWSLPSDTTRISFTIDETKYDNILITDIDFDGTPMNSQDDFETGIEAMFPGLAGGGEASLGYLVYTALVSQTSTDAPVVDFLLENTLGVTPSWTYDGTGIYSAIAAPILAAKTFVIITMGVGVGFARILQGGIDAGQDGYITVKSYDAAGNAADLGGAQFQIEIRVYP